jgi:hypothetical protein
MSYSQIKEILGVGKSTLSPWLKDYPLSKERIRELRDYSAQRIEKFRQTMRNKRDTRIAAIYRMQKKAMIPLTKRELLIAGFMLYWGEGTKYGTGTLLLANTDPSMIKFFMRWINQSFDIPKHALRIRLHLYRDMNMKGELNYWSTELKIPVSQFSPSYIKKTSSKRINHKGGFGHGTCNIGLSSVSLKEKVMMSIKAIADTYTIK